MGMYFCQELHLHRVLVGDAEVAHLAAGLELAEGLGDLLRLHERIRPVQEQHVQVLHLQALEALVHAAQDVLAGEVVALARDDAALGLDNQLLPRDAAMALPKSSSQVPPP